jgi:hypothetical protein
MMYQSCLKKIFYCDMLISSSKCFPSSTNNLSEHIFIIGKVSLSFAGENAEFIIFLIRFHLVLLAINKLTCEASSEIWFSVDYYKIKDYLLLKLRRFHLIYSSSWEISELFDKNLLQNITIGCYQYRSVSLVNSKINL